MWDIDARECLGILKGHTGEDDNDRLYPLRGGEECKDGDGSTLLRGYLDMVSLHCEITPGMTGTVWSVTMDAKKILTGSADKVVVVFMHMYFIYLLLFYTIIRLLELAPSTHTLIPVSLVVLLS